MDLEFLRAKGDKLHRHGAHWAAEQVWLVWAEEAQARGWAGEAAHALQNLSRLNLRVGDYSRAIAFARRGVAAADKAAATGPENICADLTLAQTLICGGHLSAAADSLQAIRQKLRGSNADPLAVARLTLLEAIRAAAQGDFAGLDKPLTQALAVFEEFEEDYWALWTHRILGSLLAGQGRRQEARSRLTALQQRLAGKQEEPRLELTVWADLALLAAEEGDWESCRRHVTQGAVFLWENPVFINYSVVGRFMAAYAALAVAAGREREGARNALMAQLWLSECSLTRHLARRVHRLVKGPANAADAAWDNSLMGLMLQIESLLLRVRPCPKNRALPGVLRLAQQVVSLAPKLADDLQSLAAMQHDALARRLAPGDGQGGGQWFHREPVEFHSTVPITVRDSLVVDVLDDYDRAIEAGEPYERVLDRMHTAAGDPHRRAVVQRLASCHATD